MRHLGSRPLKVSECADYMGVSAEKIRDAINVGVPVRGARVKLDAELLPGAQRHTYRIHEHDFLAFLVAIGWKHLPGRRDAGLPADAQREAP